MKHTSKSNRSKTTAIAALILLATFIVGGSVARAGTVSVTYTELPAGTTTDLTAVSTADWVKWGNNENGTSWTTVRQSTGTPIISSTLVTSGIPPVGTTIELTAQSGENMLGFDWTDGDSPAAGSSDTVVTETLAPPQIDYPTGLGLFMTATADASTRVLDVWVQGFNADMLLLAGMSGGESDQTVVSPTKVVGGNNFSSGVFRVTFSGVGETLTVTAVTLPTASGTFPNAGIFAAAIVPEPASIALMSAAVFALGLFALRRRRRA